MRRFLLKTEPGEYSYDDLVEDKKCAWSGVTNPTALKHMRTMRTGDVAFIYHTGNEKRIVGIAKVTSDPYPDPGKNDEKLVVIEIRPMKRLPSPVTLSTIKSNNNFRQFPLVTISRLSIMPVSKSEWDSIIALSK